MDEQIAAPIGFSVIFPGMLRLGIAMGLQFPVRQADIDGILHLWEMEVKRFVNRKIDGIVFPSRLYIRENLFSNQSN